MQELIDALIEKLDARGGVTLDAEQAKQLIKTFQSLRALIVQQEKVIKMLRDQYGPDDGWDFPG